MVSGEEKSEPDQDPSFRRDRMIQDRLKERDEIVNELAKARDRLDGLEDQLSLTQDGVQGKRVMYVCMGRYG